MCSRINGSALDCSLVIEEKRKRRRKKKALILQHAQPGQPIVNWIVQCGVKETLNFQTKYIKKKKSDRIGEEEGGSLKKQEKPSHVRSRSMHDPVGHFIKRRLRIRFGAWWGRFASSFNQSFPPTTRPHASRSLKQERKKQRKKSENAIYNNGWSRKSSSSSSSQPDPVANWWDRTIRIRRPKPGEHQTHIHTPTLNPADRSWNKI